MDKIVEKFTNKKSIENLVVFLILLIIIFIVINNLTKPVEVSSQAGYEGTGQEGRGQEGRPLNVLSSENEKNLEKRLEEILSLIKGAGEVSVMISYVNEVEKIPMTDTKVTTTIVSEKDSNGGERKTEETSTEESIIYEENSSVKIPVVKQNILPEVVGVIVVAEGAYDTVVKENLIKAVEATVNVPSHRIQVFSK